MDPRFAAGLLAVLFCFTTTTYFFRIPEDLKNRRGKVGIWGPPNAEFNWCEPDYETADWIAEPVNTVSNIAIAMPPLLFVLGHDAELDTVVVAILQTCIGVGSILFHGSLRYSMQLCDELPMFWYVLVCSVLYLRRLHGRNLGLPAAAIAVVVTTSILVTEQHSPMHEVWRGTMTCLFSLSCVGMAWGSTSLVAGLKDELTDKRRHAAVAAERMHTAGYLMFIISVMCWLTDNYFCSALWSLPLGLPYPHLHTCWHILVGAALYGLLFLFHLYDKRGCQNIRIKGVLGFFPLAVHTSD